MTAGRDRVIVTVEAWAEATSLRVSGACVPIPIWYVCFPSSFEEPIRLPGIAFSHVELGGTLTSLRAAAA